MHTADSSTTRSSAKPRAASVFRVLRAPAAGRRLSLAMFIRAQRGAIVQAAFERFCRVPRGPGAETQAVRVHASQLLYSVAATLEVRAFMPATGILPLVAPTQLALAAHAELQERAGFSIDEVAAEFLALADCAVHGWKGARRRFSREEVDELMRFRAAMDAAVAESMKCLARHAKTSTDQFIGTLAHDIRNPLGTIVTCAELMVRSDAGPARVAQRILNSAARIGGIVESVADFTRAHARAPMTLRRKQCDLCDCIAKVVDETRARQSGREILFESAGRFEGRWDDGRIGQLLSNLLGNAIQYGAADQPITVRLETAPGDRALVEISVHNHGIAIAPSELGTLFDPMVRGRRGRETVSSGLGLGLFICREIALAHGGTVHVESSDAKGTTFVVLLPR